MQHERSQLHGVSGWKGETLPEYWWCSMSSRSERGRPMQRDETHANVVTYNSPILGQRA